MHALTDMVSGMSVTYVMVEFVNKIPSSILGFVSLKTNSLLSEDEKGKQKLLPGIDEVIKKVDLENSKIIVNLIEGL